MRVTTLMVKRKAMENTVGLMDQSMKESGLIIE